MILAEDLTTDDSKDYLAPFLNRKYELVLSDERFDDVMKALGLNAMKRNLARVAKPVIQLTEKDGEYTLTSNSTFKNSLTKFRLEKEFEEKTPDGRQVKTVFIQDRNRLVQIQDGDKTTIIEREFSEDWVTVTVIVDGITSVRVYKRVGA